jgi:hypothetical protein
MNSLTAERSITLRIILLVSLGFATPINSQNAFCLFIIVHFNFVIALLGITIL